MIARANNAPEIEHFSDFEVDRLTSPPPGGDNGERVLVEHNGKELCLPKAALNGHRKHGDEVISEEGCSNAASSAKNGKSGRDGSARSSKAL